MRRFTHGEAFDERAMPELDSEAIDFRVASESFAPVRRLARRDLETLRLVTSHQRRIVPMVGALVDRGLVREIGTGPQDPERSYYCTDTQ